MAREKGGYSEVESLKKSKAQIGKDYKRIDLLFTSIFSIIFLLVFAKEMFAPEMFFYSIFDYFNGKNPNDAMHYGYFLISMAIIYLIIYVFLNKKFIHISEKNSILFKILDFPFWILRFLFPIPDELKKSVGISAGYFAKLRKNFFFQTIEKTDGYIRSPDLSLFKDRDYLFGKSVNANIKKLFRSEEHYDDLFYIIEGYLNNGLYDTVLYKPENDILPDENIQKLKEKTAKEDAKLELEKRNYKYFQSYMIREDIDDVTLSLNAIRIFLWKQKNIFSLYLDENLKNKKPTTRMFSIISRVTELARDIHFKRKITNGLDDSKKEKIIKLVENLENKEGETRKEIKNKKTILNTGEGYTLLKDMLLADFTLVCFRTIINQFMNLPAGTIVVKIEDYSTRMIMDYYTRHSLLEIDKGRNDGSTESFQSDNYVNLFFLLFTDFLDSNNNAFYDELYFKFNTNEASKPLSFNQLKELVDESKNASKVYRDITNENAFAMEENSLDSTIGNMMKQAFEEKT